jgi:Tfp pilus assembly protein PilF
MKIEARCSIVAALTVAALFVAACSSSAPKAPDAAPPTKTQLQFGVEMAQRGLWSEALFRFRQAQAQRPQDPRVLNNLAIAHEALGQFELALQHYQDALKADPNNRDLRRNYSRFVEFYRAFKPDQQTDGSLPPAEPPVPGGTP